MEERFIKWLSIYDEFSKGTVLHDILNDSIRCYRHGIARPALMLSYIAFMQAIRNNLLQSEMPEGFKENRWNVAMNNLRSDTKWDAEVIECIKKRSNGNADPAFLELSDTLRDDVCYWRNRRNDCAHYKDSEITLSHVSAFWTFMMDNYNKFTPLGSLQQSINDYKRHYDISLTPKGTNTDKIFKRLCLAIKSTGDLRHFLTETYSQIEVDQQCELLHGLLLDGTHTAIVISYLKEKMKRLKTYLCVQPKDVSLILGDDATMVRKMWYDDFRLYAQCLNVYAEMLRAKMIPCTEVKESLELFLQHEYKRGAFRIESDDDFKVLMDNGLYDIFIDDYLSKENICSYPGEKCHKTDFYITLIYRGGITDRLIQILAESVKGNFPYTLEKRLKGEVFDEVEFKNKYLEIIDRLSLDDFLQMKR